MGSRVWEDSEVEAEVVEEGDGIMAEALAAMLAGRAVAYMEQTAATENVVPRSMPN